MTERWKPEEGERYYFIGADGKPGRTVFYEVFESDSQAWALGNCFKTEAEAAAAAEKVKALLLSLHTTQVITQDTTQDTTQDKHLPGWCKAGEWVFVDPEKVFGHTGYKKIQAFEGLGLVFADGSCVYFSDKIKQARLRPYNADEMRALVGKIVEESPCGAGESSLLVTAYNSGVDCDTEPAVMMLGEWFGVSALCAGDYSVDGHVCGVFEHLEEGTWVE